VTVQGRSLAEVATGAVILAVALLFLGYAVLTSGRGPVVGNGNGLRLSARFDRIDGLANGADVRIAGVRVGSVTDTRIEPETFSAELTMRLDRNLRLPDDTSAEVTSEGLLGGRYVSLVPGGSDKVLADGGRITQTQGSVSLESLLGRFIFSVTQINAAQSQGQSEGQSGSQPGQGGNRAPAAAQR
jgi:phospholipid/cholesterol/gamma-HCH transport system substrate-binding protein